MSLGMAVSAYANVDGDIYWHRVLGEHWLDQVSFDLTPDPIAYTPAIRDWFPTAWLPEILYASLVRTLGYNGILGLRFVIAAAFYFLMIRYLSAHVPAWLTALVLVLVGTPAALVLQDRPQSLSLVLCAALLPSVHRWQVENRAPLVRNAVVLTWVWANLHGLWVLVPCFLLLVAISDLSSGSPRWRRLAPGTVLCLVVASLTPVGPRLLMSPILISSSTSQISEWQATALRSPVTWGFALTLLIVFAGLTCSTRVPRRHLIASIALMAFGFLAYRNAVVASVLLVPLTAHYLAKNLTFVRTSLQLPRAILIGSAGLSLGWLAHLYSGQSVIPEHAPTRIAEALRIYSAVRVLAPYNDAGYLREFGGDGVLVAIDGRSDRYGDEMIQRHLALMDARGPWRSELARLDPDVVVVDRRSALRDLLVRDGWVVAVKDHDLVLMTDDS